VSYVIDRPIMHYINEERARCAALAKRLARGTDKEFLIHCIDYSVQPEEIAERRVRFAEMSPPDDVEDLM
jgi:hypothetical protein